MFQAGEIEEFGLLETQKGQRKPEWLENRWIKLSSRSRICCAISAVFQIPWAQGAREGFDQRGVWSDWQFQCTALAAMESGLRGRGKKNEEQEAVAYVQMRDALWDAHRQGNMEGNTAVEGGREEIINSFLDM